MEREQLRDLVDYAGEIVANVPVGIGLYCADGSCLEANPALGEMVGADPSVLRQQNFRTLESWGASGLAACAEAVLADGQVGIHETWIQTTFGRRLCLLARFIPIGVGGQRRLLLLASDVTAAREREQALESHQRRLVEINHLAASLASLQEPSDLLQHSIDQVRELVDGHLAVVVRMDPDTGMPILIYTSNYPRDRIPPGVVLQGRGVLGRIARGEAVCCADVTTEGGYLGTPAWHPEIGPLIGLPVMDRGRVTGMLLVGRFRGSRPFSEEDRELVETVTHLVGTALHLSEQVQELQDLNRKLETLANTDALTGLGNRRAFDDCMEQSHSRARRYLEPYGVLLADVDLFKAYNDRYGHPAGDQALARLAQILRRALRREDGAFRYGGEEFILVLPHQTLEGLRAGGERLRAVVQAAALPHLDNPTGVLTLSIGASCYDPAADIGKSRCWQDVVQLADGALYEAKRSGRNRVVI